MKKAKKTDAVRDAEPTSRPSRFFNLKSLPLRQRTVVRQRLFEAFGQGLGFAETAEKFKLRPDTVRQIFNRFKRDGESAVHEKPHGSPEHVRPILSPGETEALEAALAAGGPREAGVEGFALWSVRAVSAWARQRCGKDMSARAALSAIQRLGYSRKSPLPETRRVIRDWKKETFREFRGLALEKGAIMHWCGEMIASPRSAWVRNRPEQAALPEAAVPCVGIFAAQQNNGATYFLPLKERLTPEWFKAFVEGLMADVGKPLFLIVEDRPAFRTGVMEEWGREQRHAGKLWMRYCPKLQRPRLPGQEPARKRVEIDFDELFG